MVLATKLGRNIYTVVEKASELTMLVEQAERYGVRPQIGVRVKISAPGVGRWGASAGERSKFGLTISETLDALELLRERGMADCFNLLHTHLGSQICDIHTLKHSITELTHVYVELLRLGAGLHTLDIGGGLGVDYDGTHSATESSMNYSVDEYAADVVYRIRAACENAAKRSGTDVPHPNIITESGRAMTAYSSALIVDVRGTTRFDHAGAGRHVAELPAEKEPVPQPIADLLDAQSSLRTGDPLGLYHDVSKAREEALSLFTLGYMTLPMRAVAERLYWSTLVGILERSRELEEPPRELVGLAEQLSDIYFCNFSIFQSIPDAWAIDHIFPIVPIHRLDERPTRRGIIADITCDSDGRIDRFVGHQEPRRTLPLHELRGDEPYYLGVFLVGAYQEILGDLHNLLGDTNAVHVSVDEDGEVSIDEIIPGDAVRDVLGYVQIDARDLRRRMRRDVERAVRHRRLDASEAGALMRFYESGLDGYTYLE